MEEKITFHISKEDKNSVTAKAKEVRLSVSSFCRNLILRQLNEPTREDATTKQQIQN